MTGLVQQQRVFHQQRSNAKMDLRVSGTTQRCTAEDVVSLADIHLMAAQAALDKMFNQGYMSICILDNILKMTGNIPDKTCYDILHTVHCVHYNEMNETFRRGLPMLIGAVLRMEGLHYMRFKP